MPQINKGDNFVDGQQVTGTRLNNLIDNATIEAEVITTQTPIVGPVASADSLLIHDDSVSDLRQVTVQELFAGDMPVVTSSITAGSASDITTTPNDASSVAGSTYVSADGLTVVVTTPSAHGLSVGQVVLISGASSGYNGTFRLTVAAGSSFTYVMSTAATAGSGSLTYTKKATAKVAGNLAVTGNAYFDGEVNVGATLNLSGVSSITGNVTSTGTANFTGTLQVGGTVGYMLTEIVEQNMSYTGSPAVSVWTNCFTSASYTKPAGEIWVIEVDFRFRTTASVYTVIRLHQTSSSTTLNGVYNIEGAGSDYFHCENAFLRYVVPDATTFTSTFTLDVQPSASGVVFTIGEAAFPYAFFTGVTLPVSKFRIYKYKTA